MNLLLIDRSVLSTSDSPDDCCSGFPSSSMVRTPKFLAWLLPAVGFDVILCGGSKFILLNLFGKLVCDCYTDTQYAPVSMALRCVCLMLHRVPPYTYIGHKELDVLCPLGSTEPFSPLFLTLIECVA